MTPDETPVFIATRTDGAVVLTAPAAPEVIPTMAAPMLLPNTTEMLKVKCAIVEAKHAENQGKVAPTKKTTSVSPGHASPTLWHPSPSYDPCAEAPCQNEGQCVPQGRVSTCVCPRGFVGDRCEIEQVTQIDLSKTPEAIAAPTEARCGDGLCDADEDGLNCIEDCGRVAGVLCAVEERSGEVQRSYYACDGLCRPVIDGRSGDGVCDPHFACDAWDFDGGDCDAHGAADATPRCGDASCDVTSGEDRLTCPADCG